MRPVPLTPLRIERHTIRPGKKVQLVQGSLFADDVEVVRATLLRLREQPVDFADGGRGRGVRADAAARARRSRSRPAPGRSGTGFWNTVEISRVGGGWDQPGPADMWLRLAVPIVAGRSPSPFQRVAAAADFGNGVAAAFDRGRYSCINPDLTITLHRLPGGRVGRARFRDLPGAGRAIGVAESVLHDEAGRIGRGIQTVLVERPLRSIRVYRRPGIGALAVVRLVAARTQLPLGGLLAHDILRESR